MKAFLTSGGEPLASVKAERFAALVAGGMMIPEAFVEVGFKKNRGNSYRLKIKVQDRIAYLRREFTEKTAAKVAERTVDAIVASRAKDSVDRRYVLDGLKRVVEIGLGDRKVPRLVTQSTKTKGKNGKVTTRQRQVKVEVYDINLPAATRALELLGRAVGEPFDGSGDTQRPGEVSALARSANDPQVIELVRKYATGKHPSQQFALPKPKERA